MGWASFYSEGETRAYRPSNGTEGSVFEADWCARCAHDAYFRENIEGGDGCNILAYALAFGIDAPEYPKEWVTGGGKGPRCAAFAAKGEAIPPPRCDKGYLTVDCPSCRKPFVPASDGISAKNVAARTEADRTFLTSARHPPR